MKNSGTLIAVLVAVAGVIVLVSWGIGLYNGLVRADIDAVKAWAQVEHVYQRRADIIPTLVATVEGCAAYEQEILEAVVSAQAQASQMTVDPTKLDAAGIQKYQEAQEQLSMALDRLLLIVGNHPDLKTDQLLLNLQAQLEETENCIAVERNRFNEMIQQYNVMLRRFPRSLIAGMFGFEKKACFEAQPGSEIAPEVEF
jgi:LemA protein